MIFHGFDYSKITPKMRSQFIMDEYFGEKDEWTSIPFVLPKDLQDKFDKCYPELQKKIIESIRRN